MALRLKNLAPDRLRCLSIAGKEQRIHLDYPFRSLFHPRCRDIKPQRFQEIPYSLYSPFLIRFPRPASL